MHNNKDPVQSKIFLKNKKKRKKEQQRILKKLVVPMTKTYYQWEDTKQMQKRVEGENDIQGEVWMTPWPGFQESSPSRFYTGLNPQGWVMATCEKCYLPGTHVGDSKSQVFTEAWSLRHFLPSTHKVPDPQKKTKLCLQMVSAQWATLNDSGSFRSQCRVLFTNHVLR